MNETQPRRPARISRWLVVAGAFAAAYVGSYAGLRAIGTVDSPPTLVITELNDWFPHESVCVYPPRPTRAHAHSGLENSLRRSHATPRHAIAGRPKLGEVMLSRSPRAHRPTAVALVREAKPSRGA